MAAYVRPATAILAYHNIVPAGERPAGDLSLHTDQAEFGRQLDWICDRYRVVPLAEALMPRGEDASSSRVAITFDDAYIGTMTAGLAELRARDLPGSVFVPPGLLGREGFWWDLLSAPGEPLESRFRRFALARLGGREDRILRFAADEGLRVTPVPEHARPVSEQGLASAVHGSRVTLGNHTWLHHNLAGIELQEARREVRRGRSWLRESGLPTVDCLAYPYGIPNQEAVAAEDGDAAVLVDGGLFERRGRVRGFPALVPRINVPRGLSLDGLALRLAGLVH